MSLNHNHVTICGRLVRDPELKMLPDGKNIASLSIATNHVYTNKATGEKKESVEYHNVILFGKQAENTNQYLKKGDEALVTGRLQTRQWEKDGVKMHRTEIIADSIQFGSKAPTPKAGNTNVDYPEHTAEPTFPEVKQKAETEEVINPEDIPF